MDQSNFNFTNAKRAYEVKFYALPQILLQGEKYKDLSDSAILLYSVLRDRLSYSLSNNWAGSLTANQLIMPGFLADIKPTISKIID